VPPTPTTTNPADERRRVQTSGGRRKSDQERAWRAAELDLAERALRPGSKTSEFLLTVAVLVSVLGGALADVLPPRAAAYAGAVAAVGYALSRALVKRPPTS
jgi:hypothetical protein